MLYNMSMSTLNKDILLQTLRGYTEANEIASVERAAALAQMSRHESWEIFDALYTTWQRTGYRAGGDWDALAEQRLADDVALRRAFETFARRRGLL